ncbi:MAG TPA: hypothetical protein VFL82_06990, partial [Thermomicrobiales bacterium]|nr:hypothetical protein [Thermomicrobiales bacterium]
MPRGSARQHTDDELQFIVNRMLIGSSLIAHRSLLIADHLRREFMPTLSNEQILLVLVALAVILAVGRGS